MRSTFNYLNMVLQRLFESMQCHLEDIFVREKVLGANPRLPDPYKATPSNELQVLLYSKTYT